MKNNLIKVTELERACEFLDLYFGTQTDENEEIVSCKIIYPFEGSPEEEWTVVNNYVIKDTLLAQKITSLREYRKQVKILQNEIKQADAIYSKIVENFIEEE